MPRNKKLKLQRIEETWQALEVEPVNRVDIEKDPLYQPRDPGLIQRPIDRIRQTDMLEDMVEQMVAHLKASSSTELNPLWIVQRGDDLKLVDGHHRLRAYKRARRRQVPARVYRGPDPHRFALLSSRLANVKGSQVQLHKDEHTEAVWQTLKQLTRSGRIPWSELQRQGYSSRMISSLFSGRPAHTTVCSMIKQLPVVAERFVPEEGEWPSWARTRQLLRDEVVPEPEEIDEKARIHRLAVRIAKLAQKEPPQIYNAAIREARELLEEARAADMYSLGFEEIDDLLDDSEEEPVEEL